jgi:hypothetical protein
MKPRAIPVCGQFHDLRAERIKRGPVVPWCLLCAKHIRTEPRWGVRLDERRENLIPIDGDDITDFVGSECRSILPAEFVEHIDDGYRIRKMERDEARREDRGCGED